MKKSELVERMGEAIEKVVAALSPDQRRRACFKFSATDERTRWYYTPRLRSGLPLVEMDPPQQRLVMRLCAVGLSATGYATAATIMGLERVLDAKEGFLRADPGRDPEQYYLTLFDRPHAHKPWGWRFEGHHISINYTIAGGQIVAPTPMFFGSNPAETPLGGGAFLRPLAGVEDAARDLVHALDEEQRRVAVLSPAAPTDIVTANRPRVVKGSLPLLVSEMHGQTSSAEERRELEERQKKLGLTDERLEALRYTEEPKGLFASAMSAAQRELLSGLVRQYIARMPDDLAEIEARAFDASRLDGLAFAWAGGTERREPYYYRLQGPRFLVECDNTQDDANHVHTVWRDPENDFGADVLAEHYARSHER